GYRQDGDTAAPQQDPQPQPVQSGALQGLLSSLAPARHFLVRPGLKDQHQPGEGNDQIAEQLPVITPRQLHHQKEASRRDQHQQQHLPAQIPPYRTAQHQPGQQTLQQHTGDGKADHQRTHEAGDLLHQQRRQTELLQRRQQNEMQHPDTAYPQGLGQLPGHPATAHGRQGSVRHHRCWTSTISYSTTPLGVRTTTISPSSLPIIARAMGEVTEILPSLISASSSPTIR